MRSERLRLLGMVGAGMLISAAMPASAAVDGLGAFFASRFSPSLGVTVYNDTGSEFIEGQLVSAEFTVFQCSNAGTEPCSPSDPDFKAILVQQPIALGVPAQGSEVAASFSVPSVDCGRVQVDLGLIDQAGVLGGQVYNFGESCPIPSSPALPIGAQCFILDGTSFRRAGQQTDCTDNPNIRRCPSLSKDGVNACWSKVDISGAAPKSILRSYSDWWLRRPEKRVFNRPY